MRHLTKDRRRFLMPDHRLEGETHAGLEAVQNVGFRLEKRLSAHRPGSFLAEDRLRRLRGRINTDETSGIRKQSDEIARERFRTRPPRQ